MVGQAAGKEIAIMSARPQRPDNESVEPTKTNKYFTEAPQTFEEWLRERGGPEAYAAERQKTMREHGIESPLENIEMEP
jgi:hypothetical protein